jgi:type IV pilus assembly protein PilE
MSGGGNTNRDIRARSLHAGFTLLELVIVMAVLTLLVTIAYPSYLEHMYKVRRADALGPLLDLASRQEQYMLDHKQYAGNITQLGYAANPYITPEGFYSVAVVTAGCGTAPCYMFTATPVSSKVQAHDVKCTSLSINSTGSKTATGSASTKCW